MPDHAADDWAVPYRIAAGEPTPLPDDMRERTAIARDLVTIYRWSPTRAAALCRLNMREVTAC